MSADLADLSLDQLAQGLHCPTWRGLVSAFAVSEAGKHLARQLHSEMRAHTIYPPPTQWLRALELVPLDQVRACIVGQDPYHGAGQAEGLAFSVAAGQPLPRSLVNIFQECGYSKAHLPASGSLLSWAEQGVLLLNTCLSVRAGSPASHARLGWETLTLAILQACAQRASPLVFMLWGRHAQAMLPCLMHAHASAEGQAQAPSPMSLPTATPQAIQKNSALALGPHWVLCASHPSPLGARRGDQPFIGCQHFTLTNTLLEACGKVPVRW